MAGFPHAQHHQPVFGEGEMLAAPRRASLNEPKGNQTTASPGPETAKGEMCWDDILIKATS